MTKAKSILAEALESMASAQAFDVRDWSEDKRSAWIYGILNGWDGPAMKEVQAQFKWSDETVARLRRYRKAVTDYLSRQSSGK